MPKQKQAIIFDFDGTIADSEQTILNIYRDVAEKSDLPKLDNSTYLKLRDAKPKDVLKWAGIRFWQLPKILKRGRAEYKKRINHINVFPYMSDVIGRLISSGADVYILSSNDRDTVNKVLAKINLATDVHTMKGSSLFGKNKVIKKIVQNNNYDGKMCWMIGDEVRDIEAGRKAGVNTIAVTWGLQGLEGLKQANPDHIVNKPQEILRLIDNDK